MDKKYDWYIYGIFKEQFDMKLIKLILYTSCDEVRKKSYKSIGSWKHKFKCI